jgi:hypothetical protein
MVVEMVELVDINLKDLVVEAVELVDTQVMVEQDLLHKTLMEQVDKMALEEVEAVAASLGVLVQEVELD